MPWSRLKEALPCSAPAVGRILFVNHRAYEHEYTGAEKSLYHDVCSLRDHGFDAIVLSPAEGKSTRLFRRAGVPVVIAPYEFEAAKGLIQELDPDLVYINTIVPLRVGRAARTLGYPILWVVRELPAFRPERVLWIADMATGIVAVSQAVARYLSAHGVTRQVDVLPNAVDLSELQEETWAEQRARQRKEVGLSEHDVVIGFVGRVSRQKGIEDFVEMALRVGTRHRRTAFFVAGHARDGERDLLRKLEHRVKKAGLSKRFFFLGFQEHPASVYPALDILVVPSLADEPFGRVAVEAMAFGKPVVAYDSGALPELVVHGETGFVVPKGDVAALAEGVVRLLRPSVRGRFGRAGRLRVEQLFSIDPHAQRLLELVNRYARPKEGDDGAAEAPEQPALVPAAAAQEIHVREEAPETMLERRPTRRMLAVHCFPDKSPSDLEIQRVDRLNVKPGASVVWRVEVEVKREGTRLLYIKHCHGRHAELQARLYQNPPKGLAEFQPTVVAVWRDEQPGGYWLAMEPLSRLPPYRTFRGRAPVIRRLAALQARFFFEDDADVSAAGLDWLPDFTGAVGDLVARDSLLKLFERHRDLLPNLPRWEDRLVTALWGVPQLLERLEGEPRALVHGDVHRGNVHVDASGTVRLIDWSRCMIAPVPADLVTLVEKALARYEAYRARQDEYRQWAISLYLEHLAAHGRAMNRKAFVQQYEVTYLLHVLSSALWRRLRTMAEGSADSRRAVEYYLAKIRDWGAKYGIVD